MLAGILTLFGLPSLIASSLNFATPWISAILGFLGWYFKEMWDGIKVMLANISTFVVLLTCMLTSGLWAGNYFHTTCTYGNSPTTQSVLEKLIPNTPKWDPFATK